MADAKRCGYCGEIMDAWPPGPERHRQTCSKLKKRREKEAIKRREFLKGCKPVFKKDGRVYIPPMDPHERFRIAVIMTKEDACVLSFEHGFRFNITAPGSRQKARIAADKLFRDLAWHQCQKVQLIDAKGEFPETIQKNY